MGEGGRRGGGAKGAAGVGAGGVLGVRGARAPPRPPGSPTASPPPRPQRQWAGMPAVRPPGRGGQAPRGRARGTKKRAHTRAHRKQQRRRKKERKTPLPLSYLRPRLPDADELVRLHRHIGESDEGRVDAQGGQLVVVGRGEERGREATKKNGAMGGGAARMVSPSFRGAWFGRARFDRGGGRGRTPRRPGQRGGRPVGSVPNGVVGCGRRGPGPRPHRPGEDCEQTLRRAPSQRGGRRGSLPSLSLPSLPSLHAPPAPP